MLLDLRHATNRPDERVLDAADALRALEVLGHARPILLAYSPPTTSPFYALLYSRAVECGIAPIPVRSIADTADLIPIAAVGGARVVLHLHWLNRVLDRVTDPAEAARRVVAFEAALDRLIDQGVAIVWTVHNILPHLARLPDAEFSVRRAVVERASAIHVMAAATEALMSPHMRLPADRLVRVPHPSFRGLYPDLVDRAHARSVLGLAPSAPAVGLVGSLQPYKGLTELLDALPAAAARRPGIRLVVAGRPGADPESAAAIECAVADPRVLAHPRHVPDDQLQVVLRGVDAVVLPYRRVLNSATLMLALEFDRPLVFPRDPALLEFADPAVAVTYDRGSPEALAGAMDQALDLPTDAVGEAARRLREARDPAVLSRAFAAALRERLGE